MDLRERIFHKLRNWLISLQLDVDKNAIVMSEQLAPLPTKACIVIDPLNIFRIIGKNQRAEYDPIRQIVEDASDFEVEVLLYFTNSVDSKEDTSEWMMQVTGDLGRSNPVNRFPSDGTLKEHMTILESMPIATSTKIDGAEYRKHYLLRLKLLYYREWTKSVPYIETVGITYTITK